MGEIREKLYNLLMEELYNLNIGNSYNIDRIKEMRNLCHLLIFETYAVLPDSDMMKLFRLYN